MPEVITRAEAKAQGLKRYFTGKPCKRGHVCERLTVNKACTSCAKILASEVRKRNPGASTRWRMSNPEKFIVSRDIYYVKNKEWIKEKDKARYMKKRAYNIARMRRYKRYGPLNPRSELQWLRKAQAMNRSLRRMLKSSNPEHFPWLKLDLKP